MKTFSFQHIVLGFFGLIFLILLYQAIRIPKVPTEEREEVTEVDCIGEPIKVSFPYAFTISEPHTCKPQCADGRQRYILYTNGYGTQCETPPGCNDVGEDTGVTCRPPGVPKATEG
ncbi:hypothetical protein HYZ99_03815 [Candidatus Peregrinibacteria bacterium]|nr:hypothetical protein [Candidatus Peregrinibacteria bacterium]